MCPHSKIGSPASCSQCIGAAARLVRSDELGVTIDGVHVRDGIVETGIIAAPVADRARTRPASDAVITRPAPVIVAIDPVHQGPDAEPVNHQIAEVTNPVSGVKLSSILAREIIEVASQLSDARLLVEVLGMRLGNAAARYDQAIAAETGSAARPVRGTPGPMGDDGIPDDLVHDVRAVCSDLEPKGPKVGRPPVPLADRVLAVVVSAALGLSARKAVELLASRGVAMHYNVLLRARHEPEVAEALAQLARPIGAMHSPDVDHLALALWEHWKVNA